MSRGLLLVEVMRPKSPGPLFGMILPGLRQGKKVGRFAFKHYLKPNRRHDSDDDDYNDN